MKNFDRFLTVIGVVLGLAGLGVAVASFTAVGVTCLVVGLGIALVALWVLLLGKPIVLRSLQYRYEYLDPDGNVVTVTRTANYKIKSRGVTTLWARSLTTTGTF